MQQFSWTEGDTTMYLGRVEKYLGNKGFGFVSRRRGEEEQEEAQDNASTYFFHKRNLACGALPPRVRRGDPVAFSLDQGGGAAAAAAKNNRPEAREVRLLTRAEEAAALDRIRSCQTVGEESARQNGAPPPPAAAAAPAGDQPEVDERRPIIDEVAVFVSAFLKRNNLSASFVDLPPFRCTR